LASRLPSIYITITLHQRRALRHCALHLLLDHVVLRAHASELHRLPATTRCCRALLRTLSLRRRHLLAAHHHVLERAATTMRPFHLVADESSANHEADNFSGLSEPCRALILFWLVYHSLPPPLFILFVFGTQGSF
jgi:hypothetical protein